MLATIPSASLLGADGLPVRVEVHVTRGLPAFTIVGTPDSACREARSRVNAALVSSGLDWPQKRITVNLSPSGKRKAGASLDLAIAVGILIANENLPANAADGLGLVAELGLDGSLRAVPGLLSLVATAECATVVVATAGYHEALLGGRRAVRGAATLTELCGVLLGLTPWPEPPPAPPVAPDPPPPDLADVRGQPLARRAVEVAAAGGHHLLLVGPPGAGKTMLARRLPGLLPPLGPEAALEVTKVHSAAGVGLPPGGLVRRPPFRAPHHGASPVAIIGGGSGTIRPGEVSLASNGVLFLDELGEFQPAVLDMLRQPLEEGVVRVVRATDRVCLPARVLLVGASNPCPCGEPAGPASCRCSDGARARYQRRFSGPLLDRFDLRVFVRRPETAQLLDNLAPGEPSAVVARRVELARTAAAERDVRCNAELRGAALERAVPLTDALRSLVERPLEAGRLTARGLARARTVARTIADLGGRASVEPEDLALALSLRAATVGSDLAMVS